MSREQWGHGYHKGIDDATEGRTLRNRYVCTLTEAGEMASAYFTELRARWIYQ